MTATPDPDLPALESVSHHLSTALGSVADHHWTLATPCVDWDLHELVDHVTGGNWFTSRILSGQSADEAMTHTMEQFSGGSATSEQAISSVSEQLAAFAQPGVLDHRWSHVVGDVGGRQILRLRLQDLIVHTWDLAQTLNPPATPPEDLVRWGLKELADDESLTAKHFELGTNPDPATRLDSAATYLARFGRQPSLPEA